MYNNIKSIPANLIDAISKIIDSKLLCLNISCINPNTKTYTQPTEPTTPYEGDTWYNTDTEIFYIYVNGSWEEVTSGGVNPDQECCPAENGMYLDTDTYKLGGELTENTLIESYGESFRIIYNPTGTDIWSINLFEPVPGFNMLAAGYSDSASGGKNVKNVIALTDSILMNAAI